MRRLVLALVVPVALAVVAAPALAGAPTKREIAQQSTLTNPTACGSYGVTWNIDLTATIWTFTDDQGRRTKEIAHIREDNTVVNTVTGLTLRDGPVNFVQTTFFDVTTNRPDKIFIVGTAVNVRRGDERLVDRGPILIDGPTRRILWSAGPHPVREAMDGSADIRLALPAFCDILR